jgi:hypothetical protein
VNRDHEVSNYLTEKNVKTVKEEEEYFFSNNNLLEKNTDIQKNKMTTFKIICVTETLRTCKSL